MSALWSYFWPLFAAGLLIGGSAGTIAFRRRSRRNMALGAGMLLTLAATALWHGPFGAADRFSSIVERQARATLNYYEMARVSGTLHHGPLTRRLILSGAQSLDDWQRGELVRLFSQLPGVSEAQLSESPAGTPLIIEGAAVGVLGFLLGLLLAYLVDLRRRYNAQWNW
jgi:hypothetical protein